MVLPIVLFAALTVAAQLVSPAKGQSLLPTLPDIATVPLPGGGQAQVSLSPGSPGPNELHVVLPVGTAAPRVTASLDGGAPRRLRQYTVSPDHYIDFVVVTPGRWRFTVSTSAAGHPVTFTVLRTVSSP